MREPFPEELATVNATSWLAFGDAPHQVTLQVDQTCTAWGDFQLGCTFIDDDGALTVDFRLTTEDKLVAWVFTRAPVGSVHLAFDNSALYPGLFENDAVQFLPNPVATSYP